MKKTILSVIIILSCLLNIQAEKFTFKFQKGGKQKIEAYFNQEQYLNNQLIVKNRQYYKTIRTIKDVIENISEIEDNNYYYNINKYADNKVLEINDTELSTYKKNQLGELIIINDSLYPTYRNIPVFPAADIEPGYTWELEGKEIQDFFGDNTITVFIFKVVYKFIGYETIGNKKIAKFSYEFIVDETNTGNGKIDPRILKIYGVSKTLMYFDNEKGSRIKEIYSREYSFLYYDQKSVYSITDSGTRIWHDIELLDKDKIVDDIQKKIDDEKIKDTKVVKDDKGVKLLMDDLHFYADSTELLPEENERLDKIANILKNYKDKNIMVMGHTALAGTEDARQKLSVARAKVIIDYLIQKGAIDPAKSIFGGKGATEPAAPNDTEANMKKNRRVEIFILEE